MKRILGVLLAGVLLLSGCGQWQKSQKESAYHLYCLDKTGTTLVQEPYEPKEGTDQKLIKELTRCRRNLPRTETRHFFPMGFPSRRIRWRTGSLR